MLSTLLLLQSLDTLTYSILSVQYHVTHLVIITACLVWFYCYTVPVECFLMAEALLTEVAGYDLPQWTDQRVIRLDTKSDEVPLEASLMDTLSALPWNRLRSIAKQLGYNLKTKATILTALTEETASEHVLALI